MALSIVMPFYDKATDFAFALEHNRRYLQDPACEVILVLDAPGEADDVLALVEREDSIRWRVLVNAEPHPWRAPSKAINVGIRHALGRSVLVVSPESVMLDDPMPLCEEVGSGGQFVVGRTVFLSRDEFLSLEPKGLSERFEHGQRSIAKPIFFGSMLARRTDFIRVHGYDEAMTKWGGDDSNLRLRFMAAGIRMVLRLDLRLIHLSHEDRFYGLPAPNSDRPRYTAEEKEHWFNPISSTANPGGWGLDFDWVLFDWREPVGA